MQVLGISSTDHQPVGKAMTDALDLIAAARAKQEAAERNAEFQQKRAEHARQRCRLIIEMANRRGPIEPPPMTDDGKAHWDETRHIVEQFVKILSNPYARYDEDEAGMTHETAADMLTWRIQNLINAAVAKAKSEKQP